MWAWKVVWDHPDYRYSYELVPGDPNTYTSLRRQIRSLKREYAAWYRHWVMRCTLVDKVFYNMKAVSRKAKEAGAAEKSPPLEQDRSEALGRTASTSTRNSARALASTPRIVVAPAGTSATSIPMSWRANMKLCKGDTGMH